MKRKLIAGLLTALSMTVVCPAAYASTDHYTDSSVVGADSGWSDWDAAWETTAADFTKVSLTPGADDTQLNFAWYSEKGDSDATPVVHFGTDKDNLERDNDQSHGLAEIQTKASSCLCLSLVNGHDTGTDNLSYIGT